jgi:predicted TIM-barrel fold metal-dependent hydrolase
MRRCAEAGHKGVVWAATLSRHGLPGTSDPYWDRFYGAAQEMGMSINFHVGVGYTEEQMNVASQRTPVDLDPEAQAADQARRTALGFMSNGRTIADIIMSGLCHRFPELNFVSVESGFGFIPYLLEGLDWQWTNPGHSKRFPHRLLPSEYFRRQIYTMFWFERTTLPLLELYQDNVLFETDFPHDTSITPGPGSDSPKPGELAADHIAKYGQDVMRKVLWENAAKLYRLQ